MALAEDGLVALLALLFPDSVFVRSQACHASGRVPTITGKRLRFLLKGAPARMASLPTMKPLVNRNGETKPTKLKLNAIRLDAEFQTRAHIDESVVLEYSKAMARGDRFPPVVVFQIDQADPGEITLVDGFHRVKAARRAKLGQILAEVRRGSRPDALRFALGANHKHGLRRTNGDKRRAVEMALAEFGNQSDHLLAEMCGVSQPFVSNLATN